MKNNRIAFLLILVCTLLSGHMVAQTCPNTDLIFFNQNDIDNFPSNYPDCVETIRSVFINSSGIQNLDSLIQLKAIGNNLIIFQAQNLRCLSGLDSLSHINGDLNVNDSDSLKNLVGLGNLKSIGNDLRITKNRRLLSFEGLNQLKSIGNSLHIRSSDHLESLQGLNMLETIGNNLNLFGPTRLVNLNGLDKLNFIRNTFEVSKNDRLTSLDGLTSLNDLPGIRELFIKENENLISIEALGSLDLRNTPHIRIQENPKLNNCSLFSTCNYLANCSKIFLYNNGSHECNNNEGLEAACESDFEDDFNKVCQFKLYPNPIKDKLNLQLNGAIPNEAFRWEIFSMQGKLLLEGHQDPNHIDLSSLSPGHYILRIKVDELIKVFRFLKN